MSIDVTLFAWNNGIPAVENVGHWNDYDVFAPAHTVDARSSVILANGSSVRFASDAEIETCLQACTL